MKKVKVLPPDPLPVRKPRIFLRTIFYKNPMKLFRWILQRLKEGSTWAGFGIVGAALGIAPEGVDVLTKLLVAAAGVASFFLKDKAST